MIRTIIILLFSFIPSYFTSSSNVLINKVIEKEIEKERLSLIVHKVKIINEIDYELKMFNNNLCLPNEKSSKTWKEKNSEFIKRISCHALESESLASVAIAQAIIETGYGKHNKLQNNIFGIKGRGIKSKTKEFINGKYITIKSEFQKFDGLDAAFDRHYSIIGKYGYHSRDYVEWAYRIKECGYATDPYYAKKIIFIIEKHELYRLDRIQELNSSLDSLRNIEYDRFLQI